jgi:hypothetical protein
MCQKMRRISYCKKCLTLINTVLVVIRPCQHKRETDICIEGENVPMPGVTYTDYPNCPECARIKEGEEAKKKKEKGKT